ncbi:unnamed protein product [Blepharisma stoltei]|uniref:Uncharacterized protein n=1 Tax=Blepharisma stoltei TaxID=1481888 RepID=A0AAU9JFM3_9CILI|nr:unnamed protein product [Blepharisma stoltei]
MKILILLVLALGVFSTNSCEHCIRLCQYNFDYIAMIEQNYCQEDLTCEKFLREISLRYLSNPGSQNPCSRDPYHNDCNSYGMKVCSDILGNSCGGNKSFLPNNELSSITHIVSLKEQLNRLDSEASDVEKQLRTEITRQKQKYLSIIDRLNNLQGGI